MLVVFKLDRLGRSVLHLADLLTRFQKDGIHFCSLSKGINTTTPGGKLVYHVFSAVAEFQREIIVENTVQGQNAARRRGKRLGQPPPLDRHAAIEAHRQHCQKGVTNEELATRLSVSPSMLRRAYERIEP